MAAPAWLISLAAAEAVLKNPVIQEPCFLFKSKFSKVCAST